MTFLTRWRTFLRADSGNIAMMFGLPMVPITIAAGVGLDYARGEPGASDHAPAWIELKGARR